MTTASALATRADDRFRGGSNSVITATQWLSYLNEAYNRANRYTPIWPWLETSEQTINFTAGNRVANLPSDVLSVAWAYDTTDDYRLIDQQAPGDFFHQDHLRSEVGQPVTYRLRGSTMELNPTPTNATVVVAQCVLLPTALVADAYVRVRSTGGVAGNITATGVAVGDTLLAVGGIKTSDQSFVDFTSEFTITAANTINNSGGTATTGYFLVVVARTASGSAEPVWPEAYHDTLIDGAVAMCYLDDGNAAMAEKYEGKFLQGLKDMLNQVGVSRTEANLPIRDTFWS